MFCGYEVHSDIVKLILSHVPTEYALILFLVRAFSTYILRECFLYSTLRICDEACADGYVTLLKWLLSKRFKPGSRSVSIAIRYGQQTILKDLLALKTPIDETAYDAAAARGDLHTLKWLRDCDIFYKNKTYQIAVHDGNIPVLNWICDHMRVTTKELCEEAAAAGQLPVLQWVQKNTNSVTPHIISVIRTSIEYGHTHIIKWLHECIVRLTDAHWCNVAASCRQLHLLKYLHETCKLNLPSHIYCSAIESGHFDTVLWLYEKCVPFDGLEYTFAAEKGDLHTLKWLRAHDCPLELSIDSAIDQGIKSGSIEVLNYLRELGCTIQTTAYSIAAANGDLSIIKWLKDNGAPTTVKTIAIVNASRLNLMQMCIEKRFLIYAFVLSALKNREKDVLICALGYVKWHQHLSDYTVKFGDISLIEFAAECGCSFKDKKYIDMAILHGHLHVVEWLYDHGRKNNCAL